MTDWQTPNGWRKSSASGQSACVEVKMGSESISVRDSKDPSGSVLQFTKAEWLAFVAGVRLGEFDS
jgi:hypothetical protein